jgi:hypothetical protein
MIVFMSEVVVVRRVSGIVKSAKNEAEVFKIVLPSVRLPDPVIRTRLPTYLDTFSTLPNLESHDPSSPFAADSDKPSVAVSTRSSFTFRRRTPVYFWPFPFAEISTRPLFFVWNNGDDYTGQLQESGCKNRPPSRKHIHVVGESVVIRKIQMSSIRERAHTAARHPCVPI